MEINNCLITFPIFYFLDVSAHIWLSTHAISQNKEFLRLVVSYSRLARFYS